MSIRVLKHPSKGIAIRPSQRYVCRVLTTLQQKLETVPTTPGVYIMKDSRGDILYVGKAKMLRSRVRSYFQPSADLDPAKQQMVQKAADLETISTDNETEALVLEANLIREHQPPYNVVLRDDKYYRFIKITNEELPRVYSTRRIQRDRARYFGPYSSSQSVRATLKLLRRIFPYRGEKEDAKEIIFPHPLFSHSDEHLGATSFSEQDTEIYRENIKNIIQFLQGKREDILERLRSGMKQAATENQYERAAIFRDQLQALERLEGFQKVYLPRNESFDVISIARQLTKSAANVFQIRQGKLLYKHTFLLNHQATATPEDILRQFLLQYYSVAQDIPSIIFIPHVLEDQESIATWIKKDDPPVLSVPQRGKKRQLLLMGETNAQQLLDQEEVAFTREERTHAAHQELVTALKISAESTHRIETYDISNIQGTLATASMVVFIDGESKPSLYRKFRMRLEEKPNDFAMLRHTLERRFGHHTEDWPMPDLIIIDGGKGQLSSAVSILKKLHIPTPVISIAKKEELIFTPNQSEPIRLPYNSDALYLIQRMRDEAHRFTITYHRLLRSKRQQRSILDEIPGIGPKTKKQLLNHFGSLKNIRQASFEDLSQLIGEVKARTITEYL